MRRLHADGWSEVDALITGLVNLGYLLTPQTRILDFGCGEGGLVYRLRDAGFDAYGFDIHDVVKLRDADDRRLFSFSRAASDSTADMRVSDLRIPHDAGTFDLVYSNQVLEHILDMAPVASELARVLKPDGISLHIYPRREALIEPHILVPLGGRIQSWPWLYFWALLGVRNEYQTHLNARHSAEVNAAYCKTGIRHRTEAEMIEAVAQSFMHATFVADRYFEKATLRKRLGQTSTLSAADSLL
jgi:SAM-dependent methyltransferase